MTDIFADSTVMGGAVKVPMRNATPNTNWASLDTLSCLPHIHNDDRVIVP